MAELTDRQIQAARPKEQDGHVSDHWISDGGARGSGRLYLRVQANGRKSFFYRYAGPSGKRGAIPLGEYTQRGGRAGLTLNQARDKASELSRLYLDGIRDLHGYIEARVQTQEREISRSNKAALDKADEDQHRSLRRLIAAYLVALEQADASDVANVRSMFRLHLLEAYPELVEIRASEVKPKDLRAPLARLVEAKKGRTAGKLRSYMRAAYSQAIKADYDPTAPACMLGFGIETNPCDALPALSQFNRTRERNLDEFELNLYMEEVEKLPHAARDALLLSLYLGGQRPTQLLRTKTEDVTVGGTYPELRMRDPKGARQQARLHVLPLTGTALELVTKLVKCGEGHILASAQCKRDTPIRIETLSNAVADISKRLIETKRINAPFKLSDIRRTAETMLARIGVAKDIRAQLLSHGLGGVQDRNYDRHTYMEEKRQALVKWQVALENVRKINQHTLN